MLIQLATAALSRFVLSFCMKMMNELYLDVDGHGIKLVRVKNSLLLSLSSIPGYSSWQRYGNVLFTKLNQTVYCNMDRDES